MAADKHPRIWAEGVGSDGQTFRMEMSARSSLRMAEAQQRRLEASFRRSRLPLYGLPPTWPGGRFLGGRAGNRLERWHRDRTASLSLVHGTLVQGEGPMLVVETALPGSVTPGPPIRQTLMTIDGAPVPLEVLTEDPDSWTGRAGVGGYTVTVQARHVPIDQVELVRIRDLKPYLVGKVPGCVHFPAPGAGN